MYRIIFRNKGEVYEVYAKEVFQSEMVGFIEIEEFVFGKETTLIVNTAEEKLKNEFKEVKRSYVPIGSIIRIDETAKQGKAKISTHKAVSNESFTLKDK